MAAAAAPLGGLALSVGQSGARKTNRPQHPLPGQPKSRSARSRLTMPMLLIELGAFRVRGQVIRSTNKICLEAGSHFGGLGR